MINPTKKTLVHYKNYVAGWLDCSISDFLELMPRSSASLTYSLITSLDSNREPSALLKKSPQLKSIAHKVKPLAGGFLLPTMLMLEAHSSNQIFFGFDELWFFPSDRVDPKPAALSLVGPKRIDQKKLETLGHWMAENGCSLALGDGNGLNIIVKARGLIKNLMACSMSQPEPTLQLNESWTELAM